MWWLCVHLSMNQPAYTWHTHCDIPYIYGWLFDLNDSVCVIRIDAAVIFFTINSNVYPMECDWSLWFVLSCERCQQSTWTVASHSKSSIKYTYISIYRNSKFGVPCASVSITKAGGKDTLFFYFSSWICIDFWFEWCGKVNGEAGIKSARIHTQS